MTRLILGTALLLCLSCAAVGFECVSKPALGREPFALDCSVRAPVCKVWSRIHAKRRKQAVVKRQICRVIKRQKQIISNGTLYTELEDKFLELIGKEDRIVADISRLVREVVSLKRGASILQERARKLRDRGDLEEE